MSISWAPRNISNIGQYIFSVKLIKKKSVPRDIFPWSIRNIPHERVIIWERLTMRPSIQWKSIQSFLILYWTSLAFENFSWSIMVSSFSLANIRIILRFPNESVIRLKSISQYLLASFWCVCALFPILWIMKNATGRSASDIKVISMLIYSHEIMSIMATRNLGIIQRSSLSHMSQTASLARSRIFCFSPCWRLIW